VRIAFSSILHPERKAREANIKLSDSGRSKVIINPGHHNRYLQGESPQSSEERQEKLTVGSQDSGRSKVIINPGHHNSCL